jgi:hypothetical protein
MNSPFPEQAFDAFISYSSLDRRTARRVQAFLQSYTEPTTSMPLKIFLDETDLDGGHLPNRLSLAISQSRILLVCCSPSAAESAWVRLEIEAFLRSHKDGVIAPLLISGDITQSLPAELNARGFRVHDIRRGFFPWLVKNPARDELLRLLSLISGKPLRNLIDWRRRKALAQTAYSGAVAMTAMAGVYYYVQKEKETKLSDVSADLSLALMVDEGFGEGEQLADWYSKDCELALAIYRGTTPALKGGDWPWRSDTFPLREGAVILTSRSQSIGLIRRASTAGTWTNSTRTFGTFSGELGTLSRADNWQRVIIEARIRAVEDKLQIKTQERDAKSQAMTEFLSYYSVSRDKLSQLEDADSFVRPIPISASLQVRVNDRVVYSSYGIPVGITEHDEDARRLHLIHFPLGGASYPRKPKQ